MIPRITSALIARNTARNLVGLVVPLAVALWALGVLADRLAAAHLGLLGIVWVFYGLFAELGLGRATTKYAAESFARGRAAEARYVARTGALLQLGASIVVAVVLAVTAQPLAARLAADAGIAGVADDARAALLIVAATLPVVMVSAAYRGIIEAAHRFDLLNRVRIPLASATYGLPAVIVLAGGGIVAITIALACTRIVATAAFVLLGLRVLRDATAAPAPAAGDAAGAAAPRTRDIVRFGIWQTAAGLLAPVLVYVDRFMLGAIAGAAAVGLYTPALEVTTRLLILPASLMMALFPAFSAWSGLRETARSARAAAEAVVYIVAAVVPFVLLLVTLGRDGLALWLNEEFARETAVALSVLALGALANATAFVPATLLAGAGRPDIPPKLYALQLPLYVLVVAALIVRWGLTGAAAAWALRATFDAGLHFWAAHRVGVLPLQDLRRARAPQVLAGALVLVLAPALAAATLPGVWSRVGVSILGLTALAAFVWAYALRAEGRARLAAALGISTA
jgi:O-antigen/teichoic acid export membrane protein